MQHNSVVILESVTNSEILRWAVTHREVYLRELGTAFGGHEMQVVCEATAALHSYLSKNKKHPLHPLDIYVHCSIDQDLTVRNLTRICTCPLWVPISSILTANRFENILDRGHLLG